jgi:hypothetical protein
MAMSPKAKKRLWIVAGAIILLYIIEQPIEAANDGRGILDGLKYCAEGIITFLRNVIN